MSRSDLYRDPLCSGELPQRNGWYSGPEGTASGPLRFKHEVWQRDFRAAVAIRCDAEINRGLQDVKAGFNPSPRYVISADPAEEFGKLGLRMAKYASRRLADQIWTGVCDSKAPRREPHHSPAWAYVLVTLIIGLLTGMLGYWLQNR